MSDTDASYILCLGIVAQVPLKDLDKLLVDQRYEPLEYPSRHFTVPQLACSTHEI